MNEKQTIERNKKIKKVHPYIHILEAEGITRPRWRGIRRRIALHIPFEWHTLFVLCVFVSSPSHQYHQYHCWSCLKRPNALVKCASKEIERLCRSFHFFHPSSFGGAFTKRRWWLWWNAVHDILTASEWMMSTTAAICEAVFCVCGHLIIIFKLKHVVAQIQSSSLATAGLALAGCCTFRRFT